MRTAAFGRTSGGKRQRFDEDEAPAKKEVQAPVHAHPSDASHSYHVQTTTNSDGSEIPSRLNNKIFIDGLPFNHDPAKHEHKTLEELMANYLNDWKVGKMMHMSKKPGQGFAYVAFRSPNSVEVAINVLNGRKFLGRPLRIELPRTAKEPSAFQARHSDINSTVDRQVLITDLAKIAEPEIIRQILRDAAPQLEAKIETIKVTSNNRKAFLTLASPEDVDFAVKFLDGYTLLGRSIGATKAMAPGSLPFSKRAPLMTPPTGAPTGYGDGYDVTNEKNKSYEDEDDMPLGVAPAKPVAKKSAPAPVVAAAPAKVFAKPTPVTKEDMEKRQIFIGNIAEDITEGMLRQHFANCGIIRSAKIIANPHTHQSSGVATVTFAMPSSAEFAIRNLNGSLLSGSAIRVDRDGETVPTEQFPASRTDGQKEEKHEEEIDTDAFFKARGIKNPAAYFASVPQKSLAEKKEEKREHKKLRTEEQAPKKTARDTTDTKVKVAEKAAAPAKETKVAKEKSSAKKGTEAAAPLTRQEKEAAAKRTAPTPAPVPKNVVSFDYDDVDEVAAKRPAGGNDSDEEERFVDVDAKKAAKKDAKKGGKKGKK